MINDGCICMAQINERKIRFAVGGVKVHSQMVRAQSTAWITKLFCIRTRQVQTGCVFVCGLALVSAWNPNANDCRAEMNSQIHTQHKKSPHRTKKETKVNWIVFICVDSNSMCFCFASIRLPFTSLSSAIRRPFQYIFVGFVAILQFANTVENKKWVFLSLQLASMSFCIETVSVFGCNVISRTLSR